MSEQVAHKMDVKQICYIDDSKTSAYVTKKLLKQHGYAVDHFIDAESALEALMEYRYELLITDLMISAEGGVNGDDLIRLIRQSGHPVKSHIPIVVVTGSSDLATRDNLIHVGADRVLPKPLDAKTLQSTIEALVPQLTDSASSPKQVNLPSSQRMKDKISLKENSGNAGRFKINISDQLQNLGEIMLPESVSIKSEIEQRSQKDYEKSAFEANQHLAADELLIDEINAGPEKGAQKEVRSQSKVIEDNIEIPHIDDVLDIPTLDEAYEYFEEQPKAAVRRSAAEELLEAARTEETISQLLEAMAQGKDEIERPVTLKGELPKVEKPIAEKQFKKEPVEPVEPVVTAIQPQIPKVKKEDSVNIAIPIVPPSASDRNISGARFDTNKENPLLSLLNHLDEEKVDYDRNQPFKNKSLFSSVWFKRTLWAVVIIGLIAPAITFWVLEQKQIIVQTTDVVRGLLATEISVPGRVVSKRKINISARMGGQITELAVKEGDTVEKGQLLVQMDDKEALSNVKRIQAQLLSVQETVAQTSKLQERLQQALDVGAVSRQRVEDAEADWKGASAQQSVVEEELKSAKMQLDKLKISAPFDGMITSVSIQEGQWVAPSASLLNIVDMGQRMAEISVDVSDSGNLSIGQTVTLTSDAFPGQRWEERITKISSEASREESANIVKVFASMDKSPADLRIGQQLDAQIQTAARSNALMIPFNVLFTHQGRPHVAIIENSKVRFMPVVLGIESVSQVEVIEGLREGQLLIVPGGVPLQEGDSVIVADSSAQK